MCEGKVRHGKIQQGTEILKIKKKNRKMQMQEIMDQIESTEENITNTLGQMEKKWYGCGEQRIMIKYQ